MLVVGLQLSVQYEHQDDSGRCDSSHGSGRHIPCCRHGDARRGDSVGYRRHGLLGYGSSPADRALAPVDAGSPGEPPEEGHLACRGQHRICGLLLAVRALAIQVMTIEANQSLQRTAGLRFSRFVAQWPAAAEFLRWTITHL